MIAAKSWSKYAPRLGGVRRAGFVPQQQRLVPPTTTTTTTMTNTAPRYLSSIMARRNESASESSYSQPQQQQQRRRNMTFIVGGVVGGLTLAGLHSATGSENDFFEYRFKTNKSADDLASFYGGEEFMELFCVFPFVGQIMMRNGYFDEEGNAISPGIPGHLKVGMVFSDETNESTGETEWFNKRERFRDICYGYTCWDMVSNFGFRTCDDGTVECYHYGEYFHGNLPVVSQIIKMVFKIHARWLAWSTEHHINHYAFTADTEKDEEYEEESRKNMPFFLLKHYAWSDLRAMIFGTDEDLGKDKPSFLVRRRSSVTDSVGGSSSSSSKDDNEYDDTESDTGESGEEHTLLPIHREATKLQIRQDIVADRSATRSLLARNSTQEQPQPSHEDVRALLTRNSTLRDDSDEGGSSTNTKSHEKKNAYEVATEAARMRHAARSATRRESARMKRAETRQQKE